MASPLNILFEKLTQHLIAGNSPLPGLFQDPIYKATVDKHVGGLNITLPEEVYTLYSWHNGIIDTENYTFGQLWIFPLGIFIPIERSIEGYHYYAGKDGFWEKSMFMLLEAGGGEMYLIDCDPNSPTYCQILKHNNGAVDHDIVTPIFDSLESLFISIVECFEKRAFYHNVKGAIQSDPELENAIFKKNNPKSKFWDIYN